MSRFRNISFVDASDLFQAEKANNDELTLEIQKWNPAQEFLISYIKECELTVFEVEKVQDFIRNEIKAKRYKGGNT